MDMLVRTTPYILLAHNRIIATPRLQTTFDMVWLETRIPFNKVIDCSLVDNRKVFVAVEAFGNYAAF
jgi:hypothetical protein